MGGFFSGLVDTFVPIAAQLGQDFFSAKSAEKGVKDANEESRNFALAQNAFSAAEAQKARDFEERMFKNRYQYSRADLEAAGYNPLVVSGAGPSVPNAAVAHDSGLVEFRSAKQQSSQILSGTFKGVTEGLLNAIALKKLSAEAQSAKAQAEINQMDADNYKKMPFLSKVKVVLNSLPGVGSLASGFGLGALFKSGGGAKGISGLSKADRYKFLYGGG